MAFRYGDRFRNTHYILHNTRKGDHMPLTIVDGKSVR
jgi:hypothetical protein